MRLGLALPCFDFSVPGENPLRWQTVVSAARRAEQLGFDSVWVPDHLFFDLARYGGPPGPYGALDPLVTLAALARATSRVRLGTLVLSAPLRPATVLAKALATLDVLSAGRLTVGIGAGYYEPELVAAGLTLERPGVRLARLAETVQVLRGMWEGGPFTFRGVHATALDAWCLPRPLQRPHPPVWLGGRGDRLLGVAAAHADGWNTAWTQTPEAYRRRAAVLDAACEQAGRDPASVTRSLGLYALVGTDAADLARRFERLRRLSPSGVLDGVSLDEWRRGRLVGTGEEVREQVEEWAGLGVSTLILTLGAVPFATTGTTDVEMLASELA